MQHIFSFPLSLVFRRVPTSRASGCCNFSKDPQTLTTGNIHFFRHLGTQDGKLCYIRQVQENVKWDESMTHTEDSNQDFL